MFQEVTCAGDPIGLDSYGDFNAHFFALKSLRAEASSGGESKGLTPIFPGGISLRRRNAFVSISERRQL